MDIDCWKSDERQGNLYARAITVFLGLYCLPVAIYFATTLWG
jgi:hypothetical protein